MSHGIPVARKTLRGHGLDFEKSQLSCNEDLKC